MSEGISMPECSLCKTPIEAEGGAVLFTSSRGVPFEVCGECEKRFETLQAYRGRPKAEAALDYINQYANGIEDKDAYTAVAGFAGIPVQASAEDIAAEIARIRETRRRENAPAPKPGLLKRLAKPARWILFTFIGLLMMAAIFYMIYKWF